MLLASKTYDVDDIHAVQELYHANGWTDGLPIVPPTPEAVEACLDWAMMPPDQLLGIEPVRGARSPPRNWRSTPSWPAACRCISPSCSPPSPRCCDRSSCCTAPPPAPAAAPCFDRAERADPAGNRRCRQRSTRWATPTAPQR